MLGEQRVQPLDPELLAAAPRLDDAVRVHDDDRTRREGRGHRLVRLRRVDPERQPVRGDALDGAVRENETRLRMPAARAGDLALHGVDDELDHRDEAPRGDLGGDDLVRGSQEVAGHDVLARERPEDVLRHRHVGRRIDAVAGHVPEHDRQPPVAEGEVVVDVAADLEARRGLVDVAELEAGDLGSCARQERALHRVGERLLLRVEPGVVDRERGLSRDRECRVGDLAGDRATGMQRDDRERREQLGRRRDRDDGRARALAQKRRQQRERATERLRPVGVEKQRLASLEQREQLPPRQLLRPREQRTRSGVDALVVHVHRPRGQLDPALVGHPDHGGVDPEQVTIDSASTSSVVSSERLCANEREILNWAFSRFAASRSEPSASSSSLPSAVARSCSRAFWTATASCAASATSSARSLALSGRGWRG